MNCIILGKLVSETTFPCLQYLVYSASYMKNGADNFWIADGLRWGRPANHFLPKIRPEWRVIYYYCKDTNGRRIRKTVYTFGGQSRTPPHVFVSLQLPKNVIVFLPGFRLLFGRSEDFTTSVHRRQLRG